MTTLMPGGRCPNCEAGGPCLLHGVGVNIGPVEPAVPGATRVVMPGHEPELMDLNDYLRPELGRFVVDMEDEMAANDHKGKDGWKHMSTDNLFAHLMKEVVELYEAMTKARTARERDRYADDVISEAADVANFAMMIADNVRRKAAKADA